MGDHRPRRLTGAIQIWSPRASQRRRPGWAETSFRDTESIWIAPARPEVHDTPVRIAAVSPGGFTRAESFMFRSWSAGTAWPERLDGSCASDWIELLEHERDLVREARSVRCCG